MTAIWLKKGKKLKNNLTDATDLFCSCQKDPFEGFLLDWENPGVWSVLIHDTRTKAIGFFAIEIFDNQGYHGYVEENLALIFFVVSNELRLYFVPQEWDCEGQDEKF